MFFFESEKDLLDSKDIYANVIKNNMSEDSCLLKLKYPIAFIQTGSNLGFAKGNNVAIRYIINNLDIPDNSKIFLLNPDTFISKYALSELNNIDEDLFIVGSKIEDYNRLSGKQFLGAYKINKPFGIAKPIKKLSHKLKIDYIYGGALFTNKKTFLKNGLLPEDYFLYWEETDWCATAKANGVNFLINENSIVYNKYGGTIGRGYLAYYYFTRNGLIFYDKFYKKHLVSVIFFCILRVFNKVRKGEKKQAIAIIDGIKDYFKGIKGFKKNPLQEEALK